MPIFYRFGRFFHFDLPPRGGRTLLARIATDGGKITKAATAEARKADLPVTAVRLEAILGKSQKLPKLRKSARSSAAACSLAFQLQFPCTDRPAT